MSTSVPSSSVVLRSSSPDLVLAGAAGPRAGDRAPAYPHHVPVDRSHIRVKAMLVAPDEAGTAHAVSLNPPTREHPGGYHRLIGGGVELGETHREAIVREVGEELGATVHDLTLLTSIENIFRYDGELGHEIVFLYTGRLDPQPAPTGATLTESDGSVVPVVWRPYDDAAEPLPLFPSGVAPWVRG
jgi:ADP-ribose pyrophosphatase YjhB (NUDIX family)